MAYEEWVTAATDPSVGPGVDALTALIPSDRTSTLNAWAEAVIAEAAARRSADHPLAARARSAGVRARPDRDHEPDPARPSTRLIRIDVPRCWVADEAPLRPVFRWGSWNDLKDYLLDRSFPESNVDEQVSPVNNAEAALIASAAGVHRYVTGQLDPDLLDAIVAFFAPNLDPYLDSWAPLMSWTPTTGDWWVLAPPDAVVEVLDV